VVVAGETKKFQARARVCNREDIDGRRRVQLILTFSFYLFILSRFCDLVF
jgi:hypothetical protein